MRYLERMKTTTKLSWDSICEGCGVPTSTSLRWIGRRRKGKSVIMVPGPKKRDQVDLELLGEQIRGLDHRAKRTRGSGNLYVHVKSKISRREFQAYVTETRREENRRRRATYKRVSWNFPLLDSLRWKMPKLAKCCCSIHSMLVYARHIDGWPCNARPSGNDCFAL